MENIEIDCLVFLGDKNYGACYESKLSFTTGKLSLNQNISSAEKKGSRRVVEFTYDDKEYTIPVVMKKGNFYIQSNPIFEALKRHLQLQQLSEKESRNSKKMKI